MSISRWILGAALLGLAASPLAADPDAAARELGNDHFVFGCPVRIDRPVSGDLITAGCSVDVDAPVAGDAVAAGGRLRIAAPVSQNVYAAGGRLEIDAAVGRNLRIAGGQVELGPKAAVAGNVTAAGGQVVLHGPVKGAVSLNGGQVTIDAQVDGDVESNAGHLKLGPNARIGGTLRYRSNEDLERDPAAQVSGAVEQLPLPGRRGASGAGAGGAGGAREHQREHTRDGERGVGPGVFWTLGLMVLAAALVTALPVSSRRVADAWRTRFGWSLLWGFIALVCIPVAVLILLVSLVGIPIGLLVALLYGALLLLGYAASGIALGQWGLVRWRAEALERPGWRIGGALAALLLLAVLGRVPFFGGFVALLAVIAGIGAIVQVLAMRQALPAPGA